MDSKEILLVEDNPVNQKVAQMMLKRLGYSVAIADNGEEAIKKIREKSFEIVLMDAQMPVMNGMDATRKIREIISAEDQPKIYVLSASMLADSKKDWQGIDVDGFIEKPIRIEELQLFLENS